MFYQCMKNRSEKRHSQKQRIGGINAFNVPDVNYINEMKLYDNYLYVYQVDYYQILRIEMLKTIKKPIFYDYKKHIFN